MRRAHRHTPVRAPRLRARPASAALLAAALAALLAACGSSAHKPTAEASDGAGAFRSG